jgi:hypothetical protein
MRSLDGWDHMYWFLVLRGFIVGLLGLGRKKR